MQRGLQFQIIPASRTYAYDCSRAVRQRSQPFPGRQQAQIVLSRFKCADHEDISEVAGWKMNIIEGPAVSERAEIRLGRGINPVRNDAGYGFARLVRRDVVVSDAIIDDGRSV